jgi:hypothetical protein
VTFTVSTVDAFTGAVIDSSADNLAVQGSGSLDFQGAVAVGGTLTTAATASVILDNSSSATVDIFSNLTNNGTLDLQGNSLTVEVTSIFTNSSTGAVLNAANVVVNGEFLNYGSMTCPIVVREHFDLAGTLAIAAGGEVINESSGSLAFGEIDISGTLDNYGNVTVAGSVEWSPANYVVYYTGGTLNVLDGGAVINEIGGQLGIGDTVTVYGQPYFAGDNGAMNLSGLGSQFTNYGTFVLGGELNLTGVGSQFTNCGGAAATLNSLNTSGASCAVNNEEGGSFSATTMTLAAGTFTTCYVNFYHTGVYVSLGTVSVASGVTMYFLPGEDLTESDAISGEGAIVVYTDNGTLAFANISGAIADNITYV